MSSCGVNPCGDFLYSKKEREKMKMNSIKFFSGDTIPLEMHKARIVQNLSLPDVDRRLEAIKEAGNNTFLLRNRDVFLDMLTDSGVNAMSDAQLGAMMVADDSYAGSETFYRLEGAIHELFGTEFFLPAHQGRACEHLLSKVFVKNGDVVPMNYHFTTAKAHITEMGGDVLEIPVDDAFDLRSACQFKGNIDTKKLKKAIAEKHGHIPFVRMEAGTNLIGGQPFSLANLTEVSGICKESGIMLVLDASLLSDNLHFISVREHPEMTISEISRSVAQNADVIYFSGRKLGAAKGGGICTNNKDIYMKIRGLIPLFEGFLTYGGMSVREMEAMAVGLHETLNPDIISQGPQFIQFMTDELLRRGVPVVTPSGGLGCHINAMEFLPHVPQNEYPAGALAVALYIISGVRGMERGTISEQRDEHGVEPMAAMELVRIALPRRVFTMSHILFVCDRLEWLFKNRELVGGLMWSEEPDILRFFYGKLTQKGEWQEALANKFESDLGSKF